MNEETESELMHVIILMIIFSLIFFLIINPSGRTSVERYFSNTELCFKDVPVELVVFLANDKTDEHEYIEKEYDCKHFSIALYKNASKVGFDCAPVILSDINHAITLFRIGNDTIFVEPQRDRIVYPDGKIFEVLVGPEEIKPTDFVY